MSSRIFLSLTLPACIGLACQSGPAPAPEAASESPVVAEVGERSVTKAELDAWIRDQLFEREVASQSPARQYERRLQALEALLSELVLDGEAERLGVSREEVLEREIAALGAVTDAEVRDFFEQNRSRMPAGTTLEEIEPRIREYLDDARRGQALSALRERGDVRITLEQPRSEIAATGPARGPGDAPVTIVEFSDYQCPFCARAEPIVQEILARFPQQVRFVYRHLPLDNIHPRARAAAVAAVCAEEQGHFWAYHERIFGNQKALDDDDLRGYASELGLDLEAFEACREAPASAARVDRDAAAAREAGVSSTPTFFVNGIQISGAQPLQTFVGVIERELARRARAGDSS